MLQTALSTGLLASTCLFVGSSSALAQSALTRPTPGTDLSDGTVSFELPAPAYACCSAFVATALSLDDAGSWVEHGESTDGRCSGSSCSGTLSLSGIEDGRTTYIVVMGNDGSAWRELAASQYEGFAPTSTPPSPNPSPGTFELYAVNGSTPGARLPAGPVTLTFSSPPAGASEVVVRILSDDLSSWSLGGEGGEGGDGAWLTMNGARTLDIPGEPPNGADWFPGRDDLPAFPTDGTTITIISQYDAADGTTVENERTFATGTDDDDDGDDSDDDGDDSDDDDGDDSDDDDGDDSDDDDGDDSDDDDGDDSDDDDGDDSDDDDGDDSDDDDGDDSPVAPGPGSTTGPDLYFLGSSLEDPVADAGDRISVDLSVRNGGNRDVEDVNLGYLISTDATYSTGDILLEVEDIDVEAYEIEDESEQFGLPSNLASGGYYVLVVADYGDDFRETNETNNVIAFPITIR